MWPERETGNGNVISDVMYLRRSLKPWKNLKSSFKKLTRQNLTQLKAKYFCIFRIE
jgi:hypothetical protein